MNGTIIPAPAGKIFRLVNATAVELIDAPTAENLIKDFFRCQRRRKHVITRDQYRKLGSYTDKEFVAVFGSWIGFVNAAFTALDAGKLKQVVKQVLANQPPKPVEVYGRFDHFPPVVQ